jgi:hypothetical protein
MVPAGASGRAIGATPPLTAVHTRGVDEDDRADELEPAVGGPVVVSAAPTGEVGPPDAGSREVPGGIGRWPFGMLAVAVLRLLDAAGLLALGLGASTRPVGGVPIIANDSTLTRAMDIGLAALVILGVIGLLTFQRWGWVLTLVLVGLALVADLIRVVIGQPAYLDMLLHVLAVFYLNARSVRALGYDQQGDLGRSHR